MPTAPGKFRNGEYGGKSGGDPADTADTDVGVGKRPGCNLAAAAAAAAAAAP